LAFRAARQRDRSHPTEAVASKPLGLILTLVLGTGAWAALIMGGHRLLVGVSPFGG